MEERDLKALIKEDQKKRKEACENGLKKLLEENNCQVHIIQIFRNGQQVSLALEFVPS